MDNLEFPLPAKRKTDTNTIRYLRMIIILLLIGIIVMSVVLGLQVSQHNGVRPTSGIAPDFTLKLFDGSNFKLSDYRGQVVLITFWGSWCGPCRQEAPELQMLYEHYKDDGFTVIGVNWLESSPQDALAFIDEFGITYPNGQDIGEIVANIYHIQGAPENFIINKDGEIHQFVIGFTEYDKLSPVIESLLAETS